MSMHFPRSQFLSLLVRSNPAAERTFTHRRCSTGCDVVISNEGLIYFIPPPHLSSPSLYLCAIFVFYSIKNIEACLKVMFSLEPNIELGREPEKQSNLSQTNNVRKCLRNKTTASGVTVDPSSQGPLSFVFLN